MDERERGVLNVYKGGCGIVNVERDGLMSLMGRDDFGDLVILNRYQ